jgi:hypothetical protein
MASYWARPAFRWGVDILANLSIVGITFAVYRYSVPDMGAREFFTVYIGFWIVGRVLAWALEKK